MMVLDVQTEAFNYIALIISFSVIVITLGGGVLALWAKVISNGEKYCALSNRQDRHESDNRESFIRVGKELQAHEKLNEMTFTRLEKDNKEEFFKLDKKLETIYQLLIKQGNNERVDN